VPPLGFPAPYQAAAIGNAPENTLSTTKLRLVRSGLDSLFVDPFTVVVVGGLVAVGVVFWLLGSYYPGSGLEQVGLRSARELAERREALEAEDLDQMLAAHNERRRARGEAEVTADEVEARVLRELSEQQRRDEG
jgi:hypothetical protein